jgi:hypothetical protein
MEADLIKKGIRKKCTLIDTIPLSEKLITCKKKNIKATKKRYPYLIVKA